jgi:creatinine amidohydrolase/Fe(II)-dependent formamide hydrolase-like protein
VANLPPLEIAVVRVRNKTGAAVALVDLALVAGKEIRAVCESPPNGIGHGCESETSFMLFKYGKTVKMEKAVDRVAEVGEFEHRFVPHADDRDFQGRQIGHTVAIQYHNVFEAVVDKTMADILDNARQGFSSE